MLGGIVFQLSVSYNRSMTIGHNIWSLSPVTLTIYVLFALEFFMQYLNDEPVRRNAAPDKDEEDRSFGSRKRMKVLMLVALTFNTVCLYIRVYILHSVSQPHWSKHFHLQLYSFSSGIYQTVELSGG